MCIFIYIYIYVYIYMYTCMYTIHVYLYVYICMQISHAHTHAHAHICIYIYIDTYIYIRIYTCTCHELFTTCITPNIQWFVSAQARDDGREDASARTRLLVTILKLICILIASVNQKFNILLIVENYSHVRMRAHVRDCW